MAFSLTHSRAVRRVGNKRLQHGKYLGAGFGLSRTCSSACESLLSCASEGKDIYCFWVFLLHVQSIFWSFFWCLDNITIGPSFPWTKAISTAVILLITKDGSQPVPTTSA